MTNDEKDQEIKDVMDSEKQRGRYRAGSQEAKRKRLFTAGLLKVIAARDARALTELLKLYEISENSPEWKKVWKIFYDA